MIDANFNKAHYPYTPLFCEENIWQLLNSLTNEKQSLSEMWVLFITNAKRKVPLFNQQAAPVNRAVIWDYHVILLRAINQQPLIFDYDTRLPFATPLKQYLQNSFINPAELPEELTPYIRKIPARTYLQKFHSDRSHMQNIITPSQFPGWPIINAELKNPIKLLNCLDPEQAIEGSQVLKLSSLTELEQWLCDN